MEKLDFDFYAHRKFFVGTGKTDMSKLTLQMSSPCSYVPGNKFSGHLELVALQNARRNAIFGQNSKFRPNPVMTISRDFERSLRSERLEHALKGRVHAWPRFFSNYHFDQFGPLTRHCEVIQQI